MQYAFLKKKETTYGEPPKKALSLGQHAGADTVPEVAILKARTLLTYLFDNDGLVMSERDGWVIYSPTSMNLSNNVEIPDVDSDVCAILPVEYDKQTWKQHGIIILRDTMEVRNILFRTFLESSRKWLEKRPSEITAIQNNIARFDVQQAS